MFEELESGKLLELLEEPEVDRPERVPSRAGEVGVRERDDAHARVGAEEHPGAHAEVAAGVTHSEVAARSGPVPHETLPPARVVRKLMTTGLADGASLEDADALEGAVVHERR